MDAYGYPDRTFSGRSSAKGANLRARHICRADKEWENKPVVRLLRPTEVPALWHSGLVHRVDLSSKLLSQGNTNSDRSALSNFATHLQLKGAPEQSLQPSA